VIQSALKGLMRLSLAGWLWLTTPMIGACALAQAAQDPIPSAAALYFDGRAITARDRLVKLIAPGAGVDADTRLRAAGLLLDICLAAQDDDCVRRHIRTYLAAAEPPPGTSEADRNARALTASFYLDAARLAGGRADELRAVLDGPASRIGPEPGVDLYLRRLALNAWTALRLGEPTLAVGEIDASLAVLAALQPGGVSDYAAARHLAQAIAILAEIGQTRRAHGLLSAAGPFVMATLTPRTVEGADFRVTAGSLLMMVADTATADRILAEAADALAVIETPLATRSWLAGTALRLRAVLAAQSGDVADARRLIDAHPLAEPRRAVAPDGYDELAYLAVRALVTGMEGREDPQGLARLARTLGDPKADADARVFAEFGRLMLESRSPDRGPRLRAFAAAYLAQAETSPDVPGVWRRQSPIDVMATALAMAGAGADGPDGGDAAFRLFQLAGRFGSTADADAITALAGARTGAGRIAAHRALRLRAHRDRAERVLIQATVTRLDATSSGAFDPRLRAALADANQDLARAESAARKAGAALSGANLVGLKTFQAALAPDEAALMVAVAVGGLEYMCVRRDGVMRTRRNLETARLVADQRLVQAALTAGHAPSEIADSQFPMAAAVRLNEDLIAPFAGCLRPDDRILWLAPVAMFGVPLAALPSAPPPRLDRGWDLAQADWLVRRHAISYPGSASALVAARANPAPSRPAERFPGDRFLGIGDPLLRGATPEGRDRSQAALRGVRSADIRALEPLPDTRQELEAAARVYPGARMLLGAEATEQAVRTALSDPADIIAFATHGLIRDDLQGLSEPALVLTAVREGDPVDDGLLTATEIADLRLAARFVVLSACNTANFDLTEMARELPALATAFALAGVPSTLGTLWPVETGTGRAVVSDLFARLARDADPARALAEAQRAFLAAPPGRAWRHPRFWAPFVVMGDRGSTPAAP
jgi:CHAT domain-containing protein